MSRQVSINYNCDGEGCDHTRDKDSNHWLVGVAKEGAIVIAKKRELLPLAMAVREDSEIVDLCGQACAIKWMSKTLTEMVNAEEKVGEKVVIKKGKVGTAEEERSKTNKSSREDEEEDQEVQEK